MLYIFLKALNNARMNFKHMLIWNKNNHVLGRTDYNYKHEPILYGWVHKHRFYGNGEFKTSVWDIPKPLKSDLHPTMKPVALIRNAILNSTKEGDIIADVFGGSGSTLIASEETGRIAYLMELDEVYCDVIVKRYIDTTEKEDIKLIREGKEISFKAIKDEFLENFGD